MTTLIILLCLVLISVVLVQIGKVTELSAKIKGEAAAQADSNYWNSRIGMVFLVLFLAASFWLIAIYKDSVLWLGPNTSASAHGGKIDSAINVTVFFTGVVFIVTQVLLFWFSYKYQGKEGRKALFRPGDNRLEVFWTAVPAIVMTFLVIRGLDAWNTAMVDVKEGEDYTEIEATGYQFAWAIRYPGADGKLGTKNYKLISGTNPLGQDWKDAKNLDDLHTDEIVLPVNKKVRVRITAKDVLHNFYLPHFRVKMDAIPGMPTYFVFTPTITTEDYRQQIKNSPEYQLPSDPKDPKSEPRWKTFNYELACAELCGVGHYSMRKVVRIVSEEEYQKWLEAQKSWYATSIRGTDEDPYRGKPLETDIKVFSENIEKALKDTTAKSKTLLLDYVNFETGSATLTTDSKLQLDVLATALSTHPTMVIEVSGHTDNVGEPTSNLTLSASRATSVKDFLVNKGINGGRLKAVGYGDKRPVDTNDTVEGRAKNRRTEFKILSN